MPDRDWWLAIYTVLMPMLTGLTLLTVLCRMFSIWQRERKTRDYIFVLVYFSLFVLFLSFSLYARMTPLIDVFYFVWLTTGAYVLLAVALLLGNLYEWRDLIAYLRQRDVVAHQTIEPIRSLGDLAESSENIVLQGAEKEPVDESVGIALQATEKKSGDK